VTVAVEESLSGTEWLLYTAADAQRELGIPAGTVRAWASREQLYSFGLDLHGRPMYRARDLFRLRQGKIDDEA
jgi:hypothetical protein